MHVVPGQLQQVPVRDQGGRGRLQLRRGRQEDQGERLLPVDLRQVHPLHLDQHHLLLPAEVEELQRDRRRARGDQQADGRQQDVPAAAGHRAGHQLQDPRQRGDLHRADGAAHAGAGQEGAAGVGLLRRDHRLQPRGHDRGLDQRERGAGATKVAPFEQHNLPPGVCADHRQSRDAGPRADK